MSNDLVQFHDDRPVTTSLLVAEKFGKRHKNVLRAIANLDVPEEDHRLNFAPVTRQVLRPDGSTITVPMIEMTRDGFAILGMGFTGPGSMPWKLSFLSAFNALEVEVLAKRQREVEYEARFRHQAEKHWFAKYPHWAVIHERVTVFSWEPSRIAAYIGRSVSAVRRAIHRMIQVGLMNPRAVTLGLPGSAFAKSMEKTGIVDTWGRKCEQLDLFWEAR